MLTENLTAPQSKGTLTNIFHSVTASIAMLNIKQTQINYATVYFQSYLLFLESQIKHRMIDAFQSNSTNTFSLATVNLFLFDWKSESWERPTAKEQWKTSRHRTVTVPPNWFLYTNFSIFSTCKVFPTYNSMFSICRNINFINYN